MQRTCDTPDCGKPHRARGLCATCYNQQHQTKEQRHPKVTVPCAWCQKPCIKGKGRDKRYAKTFCDVVCAGAWRSRQVDLRKLPVLYVGEITDADRSPAPRKVAVASSSGRVWTAGYCLKCKAPFTDRQPGARFCSTLCGKRYHRRKNKRTSGVSARVRQHVLRRDGWRCQICKRMIQRTAAAPHPLSPSIDHVIPQSHFARHDRTAHDPANLRATHFICNALRGAGGGGEQLALFG